MGIIELPHIFPLANPISRTAEIYMRILRTNDCVLAETRFPRPKINSHTRGFRRAWIIFSLITVDASGEGDDYVPAHETIDPKTIMQIQVETNEVIPPSVLERFKTASRHQHIRPLQPAEQYALRFLQKEFHPTDQTNLRNVA